MAAVDPESHIKSLLVRERYYRDSCQWEKLRAAYHPDASRTRIDISWFQGDIDGFVNGSKQMSKGGTNAIHTICPIEVHLNGNKALSESTGSISIRFNHDGHQYDCVSHTRFVSRLEKIGSEWKLLTLEAIYDRDYIRPVLPMLATTLPLSLPTWGRESYKCIAWVLSQKGFTIQQNLPGLDQPSSCEEFMNKSFAWLGEVAQ
ncbi:uncharacterized protein TRIVIDRAFT_67153 [Trichoderma virens Gv29-8]|uniref:SnoaL-like domain-containing protein n=1 Tax=Hypocrea virens (strain Gv29-8 / FGSC 10586) TaxID=413071 RepID=G9N584_HYPVG|nr:uncharacterized protein TRIVIDRAFT_67153 [Trichoderma virens Gv29-8]EHK17929.1 hypothetical protein TRIVIDRAFT_67153 [Trichoderma virens Gv29-8]UKZ54205.1 hypothetical protein TrVGV298_008012 [Trichoderma virens]